MANFEQNRDISHTLVAAARLVPHQVRLVKLSKTQLRVLDSIKQGEEVTAQQIAERCELSPSWASSLLKKLHEKFYLNRRSLECLKGGLEYVYRKQMGSNF